jgi:nitric oxide reductase
MSRPSHWKHRQEELTSFQLIRANEGIIASNQSANRDEDVFKNPDEFNMNREWPAEDPLGFGFGDHRCIAEHLAKTELTTVFGTYLKNPTGDVLIN